MPLVAASLPLSPPFPSRSPPGFFNVCGPDRCGAAPSALPCVPYLSLPCPLAPVSTPVPRLPPAKLSSAPISHHHSFHWRLSPSARSPAAPAALTVSALPHFVVSFCAPRCYRGFLLWGFETAPPFVQPRAAGPVAPALSGCFSYAPQGLELLTTALRLTEPLEWQKGRSDKRVAGGWWAGGGGAYLSHSV